MKQETIRELKLKDFAERHKDLIDKLRTSPECLAAAKAVVERKASGEEVIRNPRG